MTEEQEIKLVEDVGRIADALEANTARRRPKPQSSMEDLVGEFTSKPIDSIPKPDVMMNLSEVIEAIRFWTHGCTGVCDHSDEYRRLIKLVRDACQQAAKGELTVVIPEVLGKESDG